MISDDNGVILVHWAFLYSFPTKTLQTNVNNHNPEFLFVIEVENYFKIKISDTKLQYVNYQLS